MYLLLIVGSRSNARCIWHLTAQSQSDYSRHVYICYESNYVLA